MLRNSVNIIFVKGGDEISTLWAVEGVIRYLMSSPKVTGQLKRAFERVITKSASTEKGKLENEKGNGKKNI